MLLKHEIAECRHFLQFGSKIVSEARHVTLRPASPNGFFNLTENLVWILQCWDPDSEPNRGSPFSDVVCGRRSVRYTIQPFRIPSSLNDANYSIHSAGHLDT